MNKKRIDIELYYIPERLKEDEGFIEKIYEVVEHNKPDKAEKMLWEALADK